MEMSDTASGRRYGQDPTIGETLLVKGVRAPGSPNEAPFPCFLRMLPDGSEQKVGVRDGLTVRFACCGEDRGIARVIQRAVPGKGFASELALGFEAHTVTLREFAERHTAITAQVIST